MKGQREMIGLIQICNLPDSFDSFVLRRVFEAYGAVRSASVADHFETGRSTGVGFIEMASQEDGWAAIAGLNQREHGGRVLSVSWSEESEACPADHQGMFGPMNMKTAESTADQDDQ
jgi:RNA recognition motif-containing protein